MAYFIVFHFFFESLNKRNPFLHDIATIFGGHPILYEEIPIWIFSTKIQAVFVIPAGIVILQPGTGEVKSTLGGTSYNLKATEIRILFYDPCISAP